MKRTPRPMSRLGAAIAVALIAALTACTSTQSESAAPADTVPATSSPSSTAPTSSGSPEAAATSLAPSSAPSAAPSAVHGFPGDTKERTLPQAQVNRTFISPQADGTIDVAEYLLTVVKDADRVWSAYFASIGAKEPQVIYHILGPDVSRGQEPSFTSTCPLLQPDGTTAYQAIGTTYQNAFYCFSDDNGVGGLVLPLQTFADMWAGKIFAGNSPVPGDFAAAVITAHEFGHSIQHAFRQQFGWPEYAAGDKNLELIADCFSGVWAYTAYYSGYLDGTDIDEAVAALQSIGDTVANGPSPHGTAAERGTAFKLGYDTGKPAQCTASYWPNAYAANSGG